MSVDMEELKRLAEAATPGPWRNHGRYIGTPNHLIFVGECRDINGNWSDRHPAMPNAAFIAAANPAAILSLLAQLEAKEAEIAELRQQLEDSRMLNAAFLGDLAALRASRKQDIETAAKLGAVEALDAAFTLEEIANRVISQMELPTNG